MKIPEKIKIVCIALVIMAVFSLSQSSAFCFIGILMAVRLLYRYGNFNQKSTKHGDFTPADPSSRCGMLILIIDNVSSAVIAVALLSLPTMILYLITPYQTLNFVIGVTLGAAFIIGAHGRILKLARIWVWFITFNLSLACIIAIKTLAR